MRTCRVTSSDAFAVRLKMNGALAIALLTAAAPLGCEDELPHVRYEPTPPEIVRVMLELAEVGPGDTLYDLGSGDGRIVIEAAKRGARAVGIEIDGELVERARRMAREAGVA